MIKVLPTYETVVNDNELGITAISLVDNPAMEKYFQMYAKQQLFRIENEEQKVITGVLIVADMPIYRRDEIMGEFYQVFTKPVIRVMAEKMLRDNVFNNINLMHNPNNTTNDVQLVEVFIKDTMKGINPTHFEDVSDGSMFVSYKVHNEQLWEDIKKGEFKGFSLEGLFRFSDRLMEEKKKQKEMTELSILKQLVREKIMNNK